MLASNRGLLAFGANFSAVADSHLVCVQSTKDDGNYNTQAINIHNKPRLSKLFYLCFINYIY